jgi:Holliday junction resolvasome RuvABC endonuclease subunit
MTAVVGIDPSLTGTGIAHSTATLTIRGEGDDRLRLIHAAVSEWAAGCVIAVIEDLPTHGMGAGKTGMAQGVVRLACLEVGTPYALVTPSTLKKFATGKGNATKPDMRMALYRRAGVDLRDDNQVDAWWLHQIGLHHLGSPDALPLPKSHLVALDKIIWPVAEAAA